MPTLEAVVAELPGFDFGPLVHDLVTEVRAHAADDIPLPRELLVDLVFAAGCDLFDADLRAAARDALAVISKHESQGLPV